MKEEVGNSAPELAARVRRIEHERDIQQTLYRYGFALDYGSEQDWMECWTADAVLHWGGAPYRGSEQIRAAFRAHTHAPAVFHKHLVVNPRVRIAGATATADSIFARLDSYPDGPQILAFGRYLDTLAQCADGSWRFSERIAEVESVRAPPEAVLKLMSPER